MEDKNLINELKQGKELANQLRNQLKHPSSDEANRLLAAKILSSYEKALSMLNSSHFSVSETKTLMANRSPRSEVSDGDSNHVFKKRKISEKKTEKVKVRIGTRQEGQLDDGYCWRKYGQKDILGSKNPRGYYRCTHRFAQGCQATKQVQKSDTDPSIYEVTYLGRHTCNVTAKAFLPPPKENRGLLCQEQQLQQQQQEQIEDQEKKPIKLEDELENKRAIFRTFSFSNLGVNGGEVVSPAIISPATSGYDVQTPESDITPEIICAPTSVTNSPIGDFDISSLDNLDFDSIFSFESYFECLP